MEQRNLILAIVLSVSILLGYQVFIEGPRLEKERAFREAQEAQKTTQTTGPATGSTVPGSTVPGSSAATPPPAGSAPVAGAPATTAPPAATSAARSPA